MASLAPITGLLTFPGTLAGGYQFYLLQFETDYVIEEAGASPDSGSTNAKLKVFIGTVAGGTTAAGKMLQKGAIAQADTTTPIAFASQFGTPQRGFIQDPTDSEFMTTLAAAVNPKFYGNPIRVKKGDWLLILGRDLGGADAITRYIQVQLTGYQVGGDPSYGGPTNPQAAQA